MVMDRIRRIFIKFAESCNEPDSDDYLLINIKCKRQRLQPVYCLYNDCNGKYSADINRRNEQRAYL